MRTVLMTIIGLLATELIGWFCPNLLWLLKDKKREE